MVAFDENGNRRCKVFIRQFRKSSKLMLRKLLSIVGNILLRKEKTVTVSLLLAMERLTHSFILFHTYTVGSQEVGVYDYNPPTLILKGNSGVLHWPGTLIYVPENSLFFQMTLGQDIYI